MAGWLSGWLGAWQGPVPGAPVGDVAVYVNHLPKDATWTQLGG